jgi:hypothetical protein
MREPGHYGVRMRQRFLAQRVLVIGERRVDPLCGLPHPKPKIGCSLIVARAGRVQSSCRLPDQLGQPALHVHVNVFQLTFELEFAKLDF